MTTIDDLNEAIAQLQAENDIGPECASLSELYFPDEYPDQLTRRAAILTAKKICGRCPIASICLAYAVEAREAYGIWGGMTPTERKLLKRAH